MNCLDELVVRSTQFAVGETAMNPEEVGSEFQKVIFNSESGFISIRSFFPMVGYLLFSFQ